MEVFMPLKINDPKKKVVGELFAVNTFIEEYLREKIDREERKEKKFTRLEQALKSDVYITDIRLPTEVQHTKSFKSMSSKEKKSTNKKLKHS